MNQHLVNSFYCRLILIHAEMQQEIDAFIASEEQATHEQAAQDKLGQAIAHLGTILIDKNEEGE